MSCRLFGFEFLDGSGYKDTVECKNTMFLKKTNAWMQTLAQTNLFLEPPKKMIAKFSKNFIEEKKSKQTTFPLNIIYFNTQLLEGANCTYNLTLL